MGIRQTKLIIVLLLLFFEKFEKKHTTKTINNYLLIFNFIHQYLHIWNAHLSSLTLEEKIKIRERKIYQPILTLFY